MRTRIALTSELTSKLNFSVRRGQVVRPGEVRDARVEVLDLRLRGERLRLQAGRAEVRLQDARPPLPRQLPHGQGQPRRPLKLPARQHGRPLQHKSVYNICKVLDPKLNETCQPKYILSFWEKSTSNFWFNFCRHLRPLVLCDHGHRL